MSNTDASGEKRMTGTSERREQIIQRLRQQGSVQVNDMSALYGVSTVQNGSSIYLTFSIDPFLPINTEGLS